MEIQRVTAVILAAGRSRRMGDTDKLLLPFRGRPLLARTLDLVAVLPFAARLLVTTPERLWTVNVPTGVDVIVNNHPERGQSESLRRGVSAAPAAQAYLFLTADQPLLDCAAVEWLLEKADGERIVYPTVGGVPAMPALFPARLRDELLALEGDTGGRRVRDAHPGECLALEAPVPAPFRDIDTQEEYRRLLAEYE